MNKNFKPKEKMKGYSFREYPSQMKKVDKMAKTYKINRSEWLQTAINIVLKQNENRTNNGKPNRNSN